MNITGIDLLMTALAEERWLHIAALARDSRRA